MSEFDNLRQSASWAHQNLLRAAGIAEQIADGSWDADLSSDQATDLAAALLEIAEAARSTRASVGSANVHVESPAQWRGLLPFNRKERFYTGTVFPGLVGANGFWHLQRCLDLFGVPATATVGENAKVQFLTEYGFAESVFTDDDRAQWGTAFTRETPDIVLVGPEWLLAIEAKMFHNPTAAALAEQMAAQRPLIDHWRSVLGIPEENVVHAPLLPERLANRERHALSADLVKHLVTWEDLLARYRYVAPPYWVSVLTEALDRHAELESRLKENFAPNAEGMMTGHAIVDAWTEDALKYGYVGRRGGLNGPEFTEDVASGRWATQKYQVRMEPISAKNWFEVGDFLAAVISHA